MSHISDAELVAFQSMIFRWWQKNRRDLPWRHTRDPYKITVSEIMLQQTQVFRVLPKYAEFIEAWPDVQALAQASPADVIRIWKGMGYNRRALYLHDMAKVIVEEYQGKFPKDEKLLVQLPGVGTYTARALLVFAYNKDVACVDTNIRKIITHFFFDDKPQKDSVVRCVAGQLVPAGKSWQWHQALMDYGSQEMTNAEIQISNIRKKQIPFRQTNRFYRGEIIDMLREKKYIETKIINYIYNRYNKQEYEIQNIINGLIKDGLVIRKKNILSLPE
jgi:A/G-specific adenine glycosylase